MMKKSLLAVPTLKNAFWGNYFIIINILFSNWIDAGFESQLYKNIVERSKYIQPRKIQAYVIPLALEGFNVLFIVYKFIFRSRH